VTSRNEKAFLSLFQPGASHRDAALAYASYDLYVHPLKPNSKQPVLAAWQKRATTDFDQIKSWWSEGSARNIAIYLRASQVVVIDIDSIKGGDETFKQLVDKHGPLPATYTVKTANGGLHFYYRVHGDFYARDYPKFLGPAVEFLRTGYVVAPPSELEDGKLYTLLSGNLGAGDFTQLPLSWVESVFADQGREVEKSVWHQGDWSFDKGSRNEGLTKVAGMLRRYGASADEIEEMLHVFGKHGRFEDYDADADFREEISTVARSIGNHRAPEVNLTEIAITLRPRPKKPMLDDNALIGPIGDFIQFVEPLTETHPAAILGQALACFGNIIGGRTIDDLGPGFYAGATHHKTALYVLLVGDSASAGKGDSWSIVYTLFRHVDPSWRYAHGFSTGEGIITKLEDDKETETTLIDNTRGNITRGVHKGAKDKRCLCYEPEFGRTLHAGSRPGQIMKDVMREMWDTGDTAKITAATEQIVSNATFSFVGHITGADLSKDMEEVDMVNGFGNRFLYFFTERTKYLRIEETIQLTKQKLKRYITPLRIAAKWAETSAPEDYPFSEEAEIAFDDWGTRQWLRSLKPTKSLDDALAARARAQVRRIAIIYAISECSELIEIEHFNAALAVWNYCADSVAYIFNDWIGDPDATKLYRALMTVPGFTKTEIRRDVFGNNPKPIDKIIATLLDKGLIEKTTIKQKTKRTDFYFIPRD
jgi:hypothetical protein